MITIVLTWLDLISVVFWFLVISCLKGFVKAAWKGWRNRKR